MIIKQNPDRVWNYALKLITFLQLSLFSQTAFAVQQIEITSTEEGIEAYISDGSVELRAERSDKYQTAHVTITTENLTIRSVTEQDIPVLVDIFLDPRNTELDTFDGSF